MKNSQALRRENYTHPNVTMFKKRHVEITQLHLAEIQQMESDIIALNQKFTKARNKVRKDILKGATVQHGPIRAFIRKTNGKRKLVVK